MISSKQTLCQSHHLNCPLLRAARPCCCVLRLEGRVLKLFQLQNPLKLFQLQNPNFLLLLSCLPLCFLNLSSILFSGLLSLGWQRALNAYKTSQSHSIFRLLNLTPSSLRVRCLNSGMWFCYWAVTKFYWVVTEIWWGCWLFSIFLFCSINFVNTVCSLSLSLSLFVINFISQI